MEEKHLHQPLLPLARPATTTTGTTIDTTISDVTSPVPDVRRNIILSDYGIALRLLSIILIGVISVWANHEASKGFVITVINDMKNTPAGEKFSLFYISNDEATRLIQVASDFATRILYPSADIRPEKLIEQVVIQLANHSLTHDRIVVTEHQRNKYVLSISPLIMEYDDFRYRIRKGIQRSMAEVLLYNGQNAVPDTLLEGMISYISNMAGYGGPISVLKLRDLSGKCWEDKDPEFVAQFLGYCERTSGGFIGRLNQAMKDGWDEAMVDRALGMTANHFCELFRYFMMMNEEVIASESVSSYT